MWMKVWVKPKPSPIRITGPLSQRVPHDDDAVTACTDDARVAHPATATAQPIGAVYTGVTTTARSSRSHVCSTLKPCTATTRRLNTTRPAASTALLKIRASFCESAFASLRVLPEAKAR